MLLCALLLFMGATVIQNIESEKKAIMAVLEEESAAWYASDFDRWAATYATNQDFMGINVSKGGFGITDGWENAATATTVSTKRSPVKQEKIPLRLKIYNNSAWVVFKNISYNNDGQITGNQLVTAFLEKDAGKWRMTYRNVLNPTTFHQADNGFIMMVNYGKSLGKSIEEIAGYAGNLAKTSWNQAGGYNGLVNGSISQWKGLCGTENFKVLEQDDNHVVYTADKIFSNLKAAGQIYGVTYEDYVKCMKIAYEKVADHMNALYIQESTPEGVKVTVSRK